MSLSVRAVRRIVPPGLRAGIPRSLKEWTKTLSPAYRTMRGLARPLSLPGGQDEQGLFEYLSEFRNERPFPGEEHDDLKGYLKDHLRRFLYTLALVPEGTGSLLELGAYPYFMSLLLRRFRKFDLFYTNYLGEGASGRASHTFGNARTGERVRFEFDYLRIEDGALPWKEGTFDVILLCEVIEHLAADPLMAILKMKAALKPGGSLIVTTPNAVRLENLAMLATGQNIFHPYSRYGICGRHNREYTLAELERLLRHAGFSIQTSFTSDTDLNHTKDLIEPEALWPLIAHRRHDLGQYLFVLARNAGPADPRKPRWLYSFYPSGEYAPE
jgi:SAM-dependent methyltransferase